MTDANKGPSIRCLPNGPLLVQGEPPVVRKTAVQSEHGEPLTWNTGDRLETSGNFALCRCGESSNKPFCDGTHASVGFAPDESAATSSYEDRADTLGGTGITVHDDRSICAHAGFCGTRVTNIWKQVPETEDSIVRLAVINEVEKCPSGAITYRFDGHETDTEPDYAVQVGIVDDGPIWVAGSIPVTKSDGESLEIRARVTLCRCGQSSNKPLCDGSHYDAGFKDS